MVGLAYVLFWVKCVAVGMLRVRIHGMLLHIDSTKTQSSGQLASSLAHCALSQLYLHMLVCVLPPAGCLTCRSSCGPRAQPQAQL